MAENQNNAPDNDGGMGLKEVGAGLAGSVATLGVVQAFHGIDDKKKGELEARINEINIKDVPDDVPTEIKTLGDAKAKAKADFYKPDALNQYTTNLLPEEADYVKVNGNLKTGADLTQANADYAAAVAEHNTRFQKVVDAAQKPLLNEAAEATGQLKIAQQLEEASFVEKMGLRLKNAVRTPGRAAAVAFGTAAVAMGAAYAANQMFKGHASQVEAEHSAAGAGVRV